MATLRAGSQSNELEMMMSIPALLRHHGVHVPRFVTVAGRVVFDNVTTTPSGPVHRDYGPVTAVAPHRFHGGEEEADNVLAQSHVDWWADHGALTHHVDAMKESFPEFLYLPSDDGAPPSWGGVIDTGRGRFTVLIMTRRDQGLPRVHVTQPRLGANAGRRWQKPPHLFTTGSLCVADREDWDPSQHTVATATAWAAHWLAAYSEWRITRKWPVEGVDSVAV